MKLPFDKLRTSCGRRTWRKDYAPSSPLKGKRLLRNAAGFGIVEVLVAAAIGMIGCIVVMDLFSFQEEQRRTTTSGADAQINGALGIFALERDIKAAGYGMPPGSCTAINAYDESVTPPDIALNASPITIIQNTPTSGSDRIEVSTSGSDIGGIPSIIQTDMPDSSSILRVDSGFGFKAGQLILLYAPGKPCTLMQLTQDAQKTGTANTTAPGTMWNLQHNPTSVYNPPGGHNIAPPGGYQTGSLVFGFDNYTSRAYFIQNNALYMRDLRQPTSATNPIQVVDGIVAMRAVYGRDTDLDGKVDTWDNTAPSSAQQVIAVRVGLLVRSGAYEKKMVTNAASISLWDGGPSVALRDDTQTDPNNRDRHYRYKVYQTIIPLRNIIWGNAL